MKLYFPMVLLLLFSTLAVAKQTTFTTPENAAEGLYQAIEKKDQEAIKNIFSAEKIHLLPFAKVNDENINQFIKAWQTSHKIISEDKKQYFIAIGESQWTFPVPLIKTTNGWIFDTITGAEIILIRQLGRNELATIQTVLAYYDAQLEYAESDRNHNGILEYAQKLKSSDGNKDGLYWKVNEEEVPSPLGSLLANKTPENAYNGYYYRILTSQGKNAQGGAYNYITNHKMTAGFALIAWPADFAKSGIMSFTINHKGTIYEKNLGPNKIGIDSFDPDSSWHKVEEQSTSN